MFGEPLSPAQVVERICGDVRRNGLAAVLRVHGKLDGTTLTAETLRVPAAELAAAHAAAEPEFLATVRRIRENILRVSNGDSAPRRGGRRPRTAATCGSGICRWSASAFACRAARRRIRRPC